MNIEFKDLHIKSTNAENNNLMIVTGVPGSGKDYLLSELARIDSRIGSKIEIVNFGSLLFSRLHQMDPENNAVTSRDDLSKAVSQDVIKLLINSVIAEVISQQPAIINSHIAYIQHGSIQINLDVVRRLAVNNFVYVWSDPTLIAGWREKDQSRLRNPEDETNISLHQQIAFESTRIIAEVLGAGFRSLYNRTDNLVENISNLQEVIEDIDVK